jgi:hypothetical protein
MKVAVDTFVMSFSGENYRNLIDVQESNIPEWFC